MNTEVFESLGFSKGEIKVYLTLLELQESSIGQINKMADVTPSKTYIILDKLIEKGLVSYYKKGKAKHFQALNPEKLLSLIETKEKDLASQKIKVKEILPRLLKKKEEKKQYTTVYEGYKGLISLYDEIVNSCRISCQDFIGFSMNDNQYKTETLKHFFRKYDRIRKNLNIKTRLLAHSSQKHLREYNSNYFTFKFLDIKLPNGLIIWEQSVAYINWNPKSPTAFVIHSEEIAESNRKFFEEMWAKAQE